MTLISCELKSRYRLPSKSHIHEPSAPAIATGLICACADQEWKTCCRSFVIVASAFQ